MMIARRLTPIVTYVLIALNVIFFLLEMNGGNAFVEKWAFIPSRFLDNPSSQFPTLFTSMFMHAGWCICWGTCCIYGFSGII
jgi:membrane associated rhomboid family serine protease